MRLNHCSERNSSDENTATPEEHRACCASPNTGLKRDHEHLNEISPTCREIFKRHSSYYSPHLCDVNEPYDDILLVCFEEQLKCAINLNGSFCEPENDTNDFESDVGMPESPTDSTTFPSPHNTSSYLIEDFSNRLSSCNLEFYSFNGALCNPLHTEMSLFFHDLHGSFL